jgi:hypothetical protein
MAEQIAALRSSGFMTNEDSEVSVRGGANFLRSVDHAIRLVTGKAADGLPDRAGHAEEVGNLARRWGLIVGSETLASSVCNETPHARARGIPSAGRGRLSVLECGSLLPLLRLELARDGAVVLTPQGGVSTM